MGYQLFKLLVLLSGVEAEPSVGPLGLLQTSVIVLLVVNHKHLRMRC